MKLRSVCVMLAVQGLFCATVSAALVYPPCTLTAVPLCTFNMSGTITVAGANISWTSDSTGIANMFTFTAGQNVFSVVAPGTQEGIANLNVVADPVGTIFGPNPFITFPSLSPSWALLINFISPGVFSNACGPTDTTCTPLILGVPGPFNFQNLPGGTSSASFVFSGVAADGSGAIWRGVFTSQFNVPFQTVLAMPTVTNTFSATFTIETVPEPGTLAFMGGGLIGLSVLLRRRLFK